MGLADEILHGLYAYGYENPSRIQTLGIVPIAKGRDIVAQSQSGTGKTATFVIGALQQMVNTGTVSDGMPRLLILEPTRELALQSAGVVEDLGSYLDVGVTTCIGGLRRWDNISELRRKRPGVVVGTPGRVLDLAGAGELDLSAINRLVLDEADEMLSMGFVEAMYEVVRQLSDAATIALVSATLDDGVLAIADKMLRSPVRILLERDEVTLEGIDQYYVMVERQEHKLSTLLDLYATISVSQTVIFCNTRHGVEALAAALDAEDHTVAYVHSEMPLEERRDILAAFSTGAARILLATDLLARGIDVQSVSLVINYDMTRNNRENYVHRIGRGGRFGRKGVAISFVQPADTREVRDIEAFYATTIHPLPAALDTVFAR
ncbi:ATP-dependent RNA helicase eIF4A [Thecamonas trahens ATCC 50062]|uniref:ATP-dependent RNA helicase eIF4A n=1 Tax=Thecamonas trahens ATCC 50062 TaxID=461836 RepID=A0A0L0D753_THETB|nr:ATP-dependent RNA helicase eIF4A [Thecamonas trahens ATCC 50062]KNC48207.1 ATP-dependent RNA helicase eIF4A [Thecamonas trahens ATCC 50062]|eukprot:XP_013758776.1 ATP-dependent RNA helicase eIF4A [Thecamonas trahens ATCC 50062]